MTNMNRAKKIVKTLQRNGHEAVFAGGCVRDMFIAGQTPHDYDIATSAHPDVVQSLFKNTNAVGKAFGVILVKVKDETFEVATFRNDGTYSDGRRPDTVVFTSMDEDAKRRDFTINAMFFNPFTEKVIDYVGGRKDLANKKIRFVGNADERIKEDRLRLLRAIRFALRFDFDFDPFTWTAIRKNAHLVEEVAAERVRDELVKMIMIGKPRRMMELLFSSDLIEYIMPEMIFLDGSPQNPEWHPEGDVLEHTILVMEKLVGQRLEVQLAGMLHDIAKPVTLAFEKGQPTNKGHDKEGAEMAEQMLIRQKFSNDEVALVKDLVADHMRHHVAKQFKKSTLKRYLALPHIEELMLLNEADVMSASGNREDLEFLIEKRNEWEPEVIKPAAMVNGKDLIELGLKPGPIFGTILREVEDLQLEGEITTRKEALRFVKKKIQSE